MKAEELYAPLINKQRNLLFTFSRAVRFLDLTWGAVQGSELPLGRSGAERTLDRPEGARRPCPEYLNIGARQPQGKACPRE